MPRKHVIRVSVDRAADEFRSLLEEVRAGAEVVIELGTRPVAVLHAAEPVPRSLSACIAISKAHEEETGTAPVLDADFAEDVEAILKPREPWNPPSWEE
jgi:antitoxin (DNA-binding transcriptional repressor) of toxin-antitoxin stability system